MNSYEMAEFKIAVIMKLISDPGIVSLIDMNNLCEYPDDLIYENIFPFNRIPATEQETKTYVTIIVNAPTVTKNDLVRNLNIIVRVYTHADTMRVKGKNSTRIDLLAAKIDELLNGSQEFGVGYLRLASNTEHVLDVNHFYRELVFKTESLSSSRCNAEDS